MNKEKIRITAGGVVVNQEGKILVVNQNGDSWSLPKGEVNPNETKIQAAKREIYEESGVKNLTFIKTLGSYQRFRLGKDGKDDKNSPLKDITIFLFSTTDKDLKPIDPHNPEARWVDKEEVAKILSHPKDKEFFLSIKEEI
jgi:ADP-ribose pyrophosphatase YjhB (NUDIX family)